MERLILTLWNGEEFTQALVREREIVELSGDKAIHHCWNGAILDRMGRRDAARREFDRAFVNDKSLEASSLFTLAFATVNEHSLAAHRKETLCSPEDARAGFAWEWTVRSRQKTSHRNDDEALINEAIGAYEKAVRLQPNDFLPYLRLIEFCSSTKIAAMRRSIGAGSMPFSDPFPNGPSWNGTPFQKDNWSTGRSRTRPLQIHSILLDTLTHRSLAIQHPRT